jgi:ABC-2 type transport system permease protein
MIFDKAAAVLKKDITMAMRYRNGLILNIVTPAAQLATFYYLCGAVGPQFRPDGMPYFTFLLIGTGFYSFLMAGMYSFLRAIQEAQQSGTLEVLMTTSTSPSVLLCLSAVSSFSGALLQLVMYVGAGMLLFVPRVNTNFFATMLVLILSFLIAAAIGIIAAALQISIHKGSAALWAVGSVSWLLAGTLFPLAVLPRPIRELAMLLPFTHWLTAMRLALSQRAISATLLKEIGVLMLFSVSLVPASVVFFSWTVRRARQLGTLSFY